MAEVNIIKTLKKKVIVTNMEFGETITKAGILVPSDDGVERGIKPRWAEVYSVGEEVEGIKSGDWILISHGRWTRSFGTVNRDGKELILRAAEYPEGILLVTDTNPYL